MTELMDIEEIAGRLSDTEERELRRVQPDDHLARIWPSDRLTNIDAEARVAAARAAKVFRAHLTKDLP